MARSSSSSVGSSIGSFCLVRQPLPRGRWAVPGVPEYNPNWIVMLRLPGSVRKVQSSMHPICAEGCLVDEKPTQNRKGCRCQVPARKFAEAWLKKEAANWREGRMERLQGVRRPKGEILLSQAFDLYALHGPKERDRVVEHAKQLLMQATGLPVEKMTMKLLEDPLEMVLRWAAMRQEYAARGWSAKADASGTAPKDAWERLRAEQVAGLISLRPDRETVRPVNTTIHNFIRDLKGIFSDISRTNYLPGLKLPPTPQLACLKLALPRPKGFQMIAQDKYRALYEGLEALQGCDFALWTAVGLAACVGPRTIELRAMKPHWLEVVNGVTCLVLRNRPEEGFMLKAKHRAVVRRIRLPQPLVEAIHKIATPDSLFGLSPGETEALIRRGSAWLRQYIDGRHSWYWLRKLAGSIKYNAGQTKDAGALLGHAPGSTVTQQTYIDHLGMVPAVTMEELHPDRVAMAR